MAMSLLSKHPFDWLIHSGLCFSAVYFHQATPFATLFVGVILEYEQKAQRWSYSLTWKEYFIKSSLGDLIADLVGIVIGMILR